MAVLDWHRNRMFYHLTAPNPVQYGAIESGHREGDSGRRFIRNLSYGNSVDSKCLSRRARAPL